MFRSMRYASILTLASMSIAGPGAAAQLCGGAYCGACGLPGWRALCRGRPVRDHLPVGSPLRPPAAFLASPLQGAPTMLMTALLRVFLTRILRCPCSLQPTRMASTVVQQVVSFMPCYLENYREHQKLCLQRDGCKCQDCRRSFWLSGVCWQWLRCGRHINSFYPSNILLICTTYSFLQAVTALAFTDDGAALVSAGEDTVACAWLLMDVLDVSPEQGTSMQGPPTFQSWLPSPPSTRLFPACASDIGHPVKFSWHLALFPMKEIISYPVK